MTEHRDRDEALQNGERTLEGSRENTRKRYAAPKLLNYGSITKLTAGSLGSKGDLGNKTMK